MILKILEKTLESQKEEIFHVMKYKYYGISSNGFIQIAMEMQPVFWVFKTHLSGNEIVVQMTTRLKIFKHRVLNDLEHIFILYPTPGVLDNIRIH